MEKYEGNFTAKHKYTEQKRESPLLVLQLFLIWTEILTSIDIPLSAMD